MIRKDLRKIFTRLVLIAVPVAFYAKPASAIDFDGGVTSVYQHAFENRLEDDANASMDLNFGYDGRGYSVKAHAEINTTPKSTGIASVIGQSNADAGTALSQDDHGRFQLSELFVSVPFHSKFKVHMGLIDSTVFFDTARIANDENSQFLASDFVNNPVIDFPDYALAIAVEYPFSSINTTRLMISSTNGLADNPSRDYSSLFEVDDDQKGIFSILESQWQTGEGFIEIGIWSHNGDHVALDDPAQNKLKNYGAYLTAGASKANQAIEFRVGYSNERVSTATGFASIAYQFTGDDWTLGSAYGYTKISKYLHQPHESVQEVELYANRELVRNLSISPSIQYFNHPLYDNSIVSKISDDIWTANLRMHLVF
ncbi:carbohydrate porin [Thiomicrorhabdus heinhorstiae]|uniref:Carbohydrate porin n=1 Tax=Thiomicrorhabdus heinhorstiae TaxID=2748010 RepID=A0ABS0BSX2_9GAMM|nr:carbohydrate porin [Thiomicrorhabdus heinhorstiae]MBF6056952.1 carbohydrate porin [Thiomicrorhabdus heinhorstiae]